GRIPSSDSINITYHGPALKSQTRYFWSVRVWDNKGSSSTSSLAWFETGLLSPSDWSAKWIRRTDPAAEQELAAVRWLWLPGADPPKTEPSAACPATRRGSPAPTAAPNGNPPKSSAPSPHPYPSAPTATPKSPAPTASPPTPPSSAKTSPSPRPFNPHTSPSP